ncbi:hypothetical protein [Pseudomonas sp. G2-4]|uniref:hypothetical protein n=1 Tax=Pseudomonas sp. G2-4 TaxID=1506334 RepID=UPI0024B97221|nr:hypothetical protein [Pseudomonas sp. G2-4]WHS58635.1 hypothetical protein QNH97_19485 [Pseudomonas sp. G2-4]
MIDWIAAAFTSTKTAGDIAKSLMTLRDEESVRSRVFELTSSLMDLQGQLLSAQSEQTTLINRIHALEVDILKFQRWDEEKARYQLHQFPSGALAFQIKPECQSTEPMHYLCALCIERAEKSVMQPCGAGLKCHSCAAVIPTKAHVPINVRRIRNR